MDPRIKALIAFAPWGGQQGLLEAKGLANLRVPSLFIAGDQDDVAGYADGVRRLAEGARNTNRYLLVFENARHNVAPNPPPAAASAHPDDFSAYAEPVWNSARVTNINQHFVLAFLDQQLKGLDRTAYLTLLPKAIDGKCSKDEIGADKPDHSYWKGFKNRSALGLEFSHWPASADPASTAPPRPTMTYTAAENRYEQIPYRRTGRSGLVLPALSLGLWHNFGDSTPIDTQRAMLRTAFDLGINHFDLANNYGPPYGSAETNFGRLLREDFKQYRDELIISTKAGWDMWPGPYGQGGGSRKYVLASLDQSLARMGLDYVDIFYSHRFDPDTPLEETASALATAVQQGKALYIGISSYSGAKTREIAALLKEWKVPLLIHQPAYNLLNRWVEKDLLDTTDELGAGVIVFTALAQGLLTDKYLDGIPQDARVNRPGGGSLQASHLSEANIAHVRALNDIARRRGQSLAQMALAWTLRDPRVTSALIGASRPEQIIENVDALKNLAFSQEELSEIDRFAQEGGINLWEKPSLAE